MKIRNGFVSNSSSSSFVIPLTKLSKKQIKKIQNHIQVAKDIPEFDEDFHNEFPVSIKDQWKITIKDSNWSGFTVMDNFDMHKFLYLIGIDDKDIRWED